MLFQSSGVIDSRSENVASWTLAADSAGGVGADMDGAITGVAATTAAAVANAAPALVNGLMRVAMVPVPLGLLVHV